MKVTVNETQAVVTSRTIESKAFHMNASAAAFAVLSDSLYSRKEEAVIREAGVNALEAHQMVGKTDLPIEVRFPSTLDPTLYIKDWGPGLNHADIMRLYGGYFESTKSQDNTMAGGFGLGAKSPFALTDSFTVISSHAGVRRVYMAYKKAGVPTIELRDESEIPAGDEWSTGLMVTFPVGKDQGNLLVSAARRVFGWFPTMPRLLNCQEKIKAHSVIGELPGFKFGYSVPSVWLDPTAPDTKVEMTGTVLGCSILQNCSGFALGPVVKIGPVAYPLDIDMLRLPTNVAAVMQQTRHVLEVPIGAVSVAPSREMLSYTPMTKAYLEAALLALLNHRVDKLIEEVAPLKPLEKTTRLALTRAEFGPDSAIAGFVYFEMLRKHYKPYMGPLCVPYMPEIGKCGVSLIVAELTQRSHKASLSTRQVVSSHGNIAFVMNARVSATTRDLVLNSGSDAVLLVNDIGKALKQVVKSQFEAFSASPASERTFLYLVVENNDPVALAAVLKWADDFGLKTALASDWGEAQLVAARSSGAVLPTYGRTRPCAKSETVLTLRDVTDHEVKVDIGDPTPKVYVKANQVLKQLTVGAGQKMTYDSRHRVLSLLRTISPEAVRELGLDSLYIADAKVVPRLARRKNWTELGDALEAFCGQVDVAKAIRSMHIAHWSGHPRNDHSPQQGSWLTWGFVRRPRLQGALKKELKGYKLLALLEHLESASCEKKYEHARALSWLVFYNYLPKGVVSGATVQTAAVDRMLARMFPGLAVVDISVVASYDNDDKARLVRLLRGWLDVTKQGPV